jgi:hypothetical protein
MISQFFESLRKPRVRVQVSYSSANDVQAKAAKLGITVPEYWRRKHVVSTEAGKCQFHLGQTVYPSRPKDYIRYGEVKVMAICRDYDFYGDVEWNEPPFILQLVDTRQSVVNCTIGWASTVPPKLEPVSTDENLGAC